MCPTLISLTHICVCLCVSMCAMGVVFRIRDVSAYTEFFTFSDFSTHTYAHTYFVFILFIFFLFSLCLLGISTRCTCCALARSFPQLRLFFVVVLFFKLRSHSLFRSHSFAYVSARMRYSYVVYFSAQVIYNYNNNTSNSSKQQQHCSNILTVQHTYIYKRNR